MAKIEGVIKSEIVRLAKREIRTTFIPLRREVRAMRLKLSGLSKNFSVLNRVAKEQLRQVEKKGVKLEASPEEVKASRITPGRIRNLRKKLGLSQRELGILTGVVTWAVNRWESGTFKPRGDKKAALVALRKMRKGEVKKLLGEKAGTKVKAKGKRPVVKTRRKRPSKRVIRRRK
jgi:DNA-binding transcriptional regulator YiaG